MGAPGGRALAAAEDTGESGRGVGLVYVYEGGAEVQGAASPLLLVQKLASVHCPVKACSGNEFGAAIAAASSAVHPSECDKGFSPGTTRERVLAFRHSGP